MGNDGLKLGVGAAHEFEIAARQAGWTNDDLTRLTQSDEMLRNVRAYIRGEVKATEPERPWTERDGVIYFTVTSDGTTGSEWITRLENAGYRLGEYAKDLLISPDFAPTAGVTYEVVILKGMLFNDSDRITKKIRAKAADMGFTTPNAEVACLIREKFTDEDLKAMGLWWIVAMHEPIKDSDDGVPRLLSTHRDDDGRWLSAYYGSPGSGWYREFGFAFVAAQES